MGDQKTNIYFDSVLEIWDKGGVNRQNLLELQV